MKNMLGSFGRHEIDPKLNKPASIKPTKVPLAQSPVVARIRKTQFGKTTAMPTGVDVKQAAQKAAQLFAKAPKLAIKRLAK